jgi:hypothetical protein
VAQEKGRSGTTQSMKTLLRECSVEAELCLSLSGRSDCLFFFLQEMVHHKITSRSHDLQYAAQRESRQMSNSTPCSACVCDIAKVTRSQVYMKVCDGWTRAETCIC